MMRFEDTTAVVTGASSGIGRAVAVRLASEGAHVVLADLQSESRSSEEVGTTREVIEAAGGSCEFVSCDVGHSPAVEDMMRHVDSMAPGFAILVNSAGIFVRNSVVDVTDEELEHVLNVNLKGYFNTCRAAISRFLADDRGCIVNVSSIHGILGASAATTYCVTKGAIENLTRQLAVDYAPNGIRVNAVSPGTIITAMSKPFRDNAKFLEEYERRTLLPRLGDPGDVANAVAFLASDEASFITGHSLVVDGGWTIA